MKIIEERKLKTFASKIRKLAKTCDSINAFYGQVNTLQNKSLQDLSFQSDLKFFDEVNKILSVIISIVSKPKIAIRNEEIVIRSELAHQLQPDMFKKTTMDSQMWKHKDDGMAPEYVYYHQSEDEINTMENQFVVMVIDIIADECNKYESFYVGLISSIEKGNLSLHHGQVDNALDKILYLNRKIRKIKSTYFYKTISKRRVKIRHITPTNILLKDNLYKHVFKFYRKLITYNDSNSRMKDLTQYFYWLMLKSLSELGFTLVDNSSNQKIFKNGRFKIKPFIYFENESFKLKIRKDPDFDGFQIQVINKKIKNLVLNHLLLVDSSVNFTYPLTLDETKYSSVHAISIFAEARMENNEVEIIDNAIEEETLMKRYLESITMLLKAGYRIYSRFCPSCKSKNLEEDKGIYVCEDCGTVYTFTKKNEELYFIKLRRGKDGAR
jgi:hypothetical protein